MKFIFTLLLGFYSFISIGLFAQGGCNLTNYTGAYIINLNDYPYLSPVSGITVTSTIVGPNTTPNTSYNCGGNTFATSNPPFWINSTAQSWTLTFSVPVTEFTMVINGTDNGEVFTVTPATGTVTLTNFCAPNFTSVGNTLSCNSSTAGTIFTVNNPTASLSYVITHNGAVSGSRIALLDCIVGGCTSIDTVPVAICDNESYAINNKIYTRPGTYIDTFKIGACDSIVYTQLTVHPTYTTTIVDSVYEDIPYNFNGVDYFYSGRYNSVFKTVNGCDSTVRLDLTVIPVKRIFVDTTICDDKKVAYHQKEYHTQNLYIDTFIFEDHHEILMLNLKVRQKPKITVEIEGRNWDDLCIGEPVTFVAKGGERYEWFKVQDPLNIMYHTGSTLKGWAYDSVTYLMVKGYDDMGCYNEYFYDLKGKNCCQYFIPTAFTPNGDGLNDEFVVKGFQPQEYKVQIFNRLGQLVFQTEKIDVGWKGISSNGTEYPTDVYFYHINGRCFDGTVINETGDITLIR